MTDQDDLRYPVGRFRPPAASMPGIRAAHIETLRLLPERLARRGRRPQAKPSSTRPIATAAGPCARSCITSPTATPTPSSASSSRSLRIGPPSSPTTRPRGRACPTPPAHRRLAGLHRRAARPLGGPPRIHVGRGFPARLQPSGDGPAKSGRNRWRSTSGTPAITSPTSPACARAWAW
jgi:hypothetical protein